MAGQAAVSLQNNILLQDIYNLFEGFVKASVTAIEQRDPTTSGHSFRVAEYAVRLAKAVDQHKNGSYANTSFDRTDIRELRYASLLHDFGKVGVCEDVLLKAKKLHPHEIENIKLRYHLLLMNIYEQYYKLLLKSIQQPGSTNQEEIQKKRDLAIKKVNKIFVMVKQAVEPTILHENNFQQLKELTQNIKIHLKDNTSIPLLTNNELNNLLISKGSLNTEERKIIEIACNTYLYISNTKYHGQMILPVYQTLPMAIMKNLMAQVIHLNYRLIRYQHQLG